MIKDQQKYKYYSTLDKLMETEKNIFCNSKSKSVTKLRPIDINIGDVVEFGSFNNSTIQWKVLSKENSEVLLISKYCLLNKPYNNVKRPTTWEKCSLRRWLNGDFLQNCFSKVEKNRIVSKAIDILDNSIHFSEDENHKNDKVFLLSIDEVKKYFPSDEERRSILINGSPVGWWLRSLGCDNTNAALVYHDGKIFQSGNDIDVVNNAVRPAVWINMNSNKLEYIYNIKKELSTWIGTDLSVKEKNELKILDELINKIL